MWTQFWDMHSGGGQKEPWACIYIEAPEDEAKIIFFNRFGHSPERVSCTCCGDDYSISTNESLRVLTGFHRNCRSLETPRDPKTGLFNNDDPVLKAHYYLEEGEEPPAGYAVSSRDPFGEYLTLDQYIALEEVLVISAPEIKPEERSGTLPEQGYVWVD